MTRTKVDFTERQWKIVKYALHRFMSDSYERAQAAAQDLDERWYTRGAHNHFLKDAKDAEELLLLIDTITKRVD
jgi:L-lactate utilization protein LutB